MECQRCGRMNVDEARFCASCGTLLEIVASPPGATSEDRGDSLGRAGGIPARDLAALLSETLRIYRVNFGPIIMISFLANTPAMVAAVTPGPLAFVLFVLNYVFVTLSEAPMSHMAAQDTLGREVRLERAFTRFQQRLPDLLVSSLLVTILLLIAGVLSIVLIGIPLFIYLLVILNFYIQPIIFERRDAAGGIGRSRELVTGSWWRVFGIGVVFTLVWGGVVVVGALLSIPFGEGPLGSLVATVGSILALPISNIASTVVYFDLRVRKEGYTLDELAAEVGR